MRLVPPEQNDKKIIMNKGWFVADVATAIRWYHHTISATHFSLRLSDCVQGAAAAKKNGLLDHT